MFFVCIELGCLGLDRVFGLENRHGENARAKYRDLSTAAAKCAASGRDDDSWRERMNTNARTTASAKAKCGGFFAALRMTIIFSYATHNHFLPLRHL